MTGLEMKMNEAESGHREEGVQTSSQLRSSGFSEEVSIEHTPEQ